jgi:hypothetical protein
MKLERSYLPLALTLAIAFIFEPSYAAPQGQVEFVAALRRMASKNTLNYLDTCNIQDEEKRTAYGLKLLDDMMELNFGKLSISTLTRDLNALSDSTSPNLCKSAKNLQCSSSSGKCECANGISNGMNVKSIRENGECVVATGSACAPREDSHNAYGIERPNWNKCQANSKCVMKGSTHLTCTDEAIEKFLLDDFGGSAEVAEDPYGFMKRAKELAFQGVCICAPFNGYNEQKHYSSWNPGKTNGVGTIGAQGTTICVIFFIAKYLLNC